MVEEKKVMKKLSEYTDNERENALREIRAKILSNKALVPEENLLWTEYNEYLQFQEQKQQEEAQRILAEQEANKQEELLQEYETAPEEEKLGAQEEGIYLKHGTSPVTNFITKTKMNKLLKKVKKKGGTVIQKVYLDSSVEFIWTNKPKTFVEFVRIDENGAKVRNISRVTKTKHRVKGTSVPLHIAIEGVSENADLIQGINTSLSAQHINQTISLAYQTGFLDALDAKEQKPKKFDIEKGIILIVLIILVVMLYLAWQQYQLFELVSSLAPQVVASATGSV